MADAPCCDGQCSALREPSHRTPPWKSLVLLGLLGGGLLGLLLLCQNTLQYFRVVGSDDVYAIQVGVMAQIILSIHCPNVHLYAQLLGFLQQGAS